MLGMFESDLPIGRRLWTILIVLVVLDKLTYLPLSSPETNPIQFVIEILLFFGIVTVINIPVFLIATFLLYIRKRITRIKIEKEDPYRAAVRSKDADWVGDVIANCSFIVAIALAIPLFGTSSMKLWGSIGLVFLIIGQALDEDSINIKVKEILELKSNKDGSIHAKLLLPEKVEYSLTDTDWLTECQMLLSNGWEIVESKSIGTLPSAVFQRERVFDRLGDRSELRKKRLAPDKGEPTIVAIGILIVIIVIIAFPALQGPNIIVNHPVANLINTEREYFNDIGIHPVNPS